ncbi:hypothetical protein HKT18_04180 [Flavobacterium sp. IMCC34852]|uniref:Seryl-tRNA synthetase n=1 Tax=Flavobacterium rivulicola TaxID=2732161 RepID=A0A7Y3R7L2_9FLAO|nr:hypothetical protein [Flavobacterium sp. IMCC34852]NNT71409.1 hypothetical protein [Flavobacterium sp. IMCC34852]
MKTITKFRMALLLCALAITAPVLSNTTEPTNTITATNSPANDAEAKAKAELLIRRLEEIKAMDKSNLTRVEKRALRKEVKEIKSTLKASGQGVYLSVGAIIIIILLLILLL